MDNQQYLAGDEIAVRYYINVILKRRKLILSLFFFCMVTAVMTVSFSSRVYEISMIIEPYVFGVTNEAKTQHLDSPKAIGMAIKGGAFNSRVAEELHLSPEEGGIEFNTLELEGTQLIKVTLKKSEDKIAIGKAALNQLFKIIADENNSMIENQKTLYDRQIKVIINDIAKCNIAIKQRQAQLKIFEEREKELIDAIRENKQFLEKLNSQQSQLLNTPKIDYPLLANYANISHNNFAQRVHLNKELSDLKLKKEEIRAENEKMAEEVDKRNIEIEKINFLKGNVRNIGLIQEPKISLVPIRPTKTQKIAMAGIMGLLLGIFSAFFIEFWQKNR